MTLEYKRYRSNSNDQSLPFDVAQFLEQEEKVWHSFKTIEADDFYIIEQQEFRTIKPYTREQLNYVVFCGYYDEEILAATFIQQKIPFDVRRGIYLMFITKYVTKGDFEYKKSYFTSTSDEKIQRDLNRTHNEVDKKILFRVLTAYANYNKQVGYTQGMNVIAANIIIFMSSKINDKNLSDIEIIEDEEDSFWMFVYFMQTLNDQFIEKTPGLFHRLNILKYNLEQSVPEVVMHLNQLGITDPGLCFSSYYIGLLMQKSPRKLCRLIFEQYMIWKDNFIHKLILTIIDKYSNKIREHDDLGTLLPYLSEKILHQFALDFFKLKKHVRVEYFQTKQLFKPTLSEPYHIKNIQNAANTEIFQEKQIMIISPVSLLNFDQQNIRDPILNSPKSFEACRRQGINPRELVMKSIADVKKENRQLNLDEEGWRMMWEHQEERRQGKIQLLIEERDEIREEEDDTIMQSIENDKFIQKEKKRIEMIKRQKQKQMDRMLDYEVKMQEMRQKMEEKERLQYEKEQRYQRELKEKRDRLKKEEQQRKFQIEYQEYLRQEKNKEIQFKLSKEANKKDEMYEQKKNEQLFQQQQRDEQVRLAQLDRERQQKERENLQEQLYEAKLLKMQEKEEKRVKLLEQEQDLRQMLNKIKQEEVEYRRQQTKKKNEQNLEQIYKDFQKKQELAEMKLKAKQKEIEIMNKQNQKKLSMKIEQRKQIQNQNVNLQEKRRNELELKFQEIEDRYKLNELNRKITQEQKKDFQRERDMYRQDILEKNNLQLQEQINKINMKRQKKEYQAQLVIQEQQEIIKQKKLEEEIKKFDQIENIKRIQRIKEDQKEKLKKRIDIKLKRRDDLSVKKQETEKERQKLRNEIQKQKEDLKVQIKEIQQGKSIPMRPKSAVEPQKKREAHQKRNVMEEITNERKLQNLKFRQNKEMLELLEQEESNELARKKLLHQVSDLDERTRLEKILGAERAQVEYKIFQMAERHDKEYEQLKQQLELQE